VAKEAAVMRESVFRVGLFSNPGILYGIAAEVGLLIGLIVVPPLQTAFNTAALSFSEWSVLLALPPLMLVLEEGRKWVVRRKVARCAAVEDA
jgi:P-type Ca2+ transporter type 2C